MTCPICLHKNEKPFSLDCNHSFHEECIQKWLNINNSCPICRKPDISVKKLNNKLSELIEEINSLSGFQIAHHGINFEKLNHSLKYMAILESLKNKLINYRSIRNDGFSADHLASEIGYMFDDINIEFRLLSIN